MNEMNVLKEGTSMSLESYKVSKILLRDLEKEEEKNSFGVSLGVSKNLENEDETILGIGVKVSTTERFVEIIFEGLFAFANDVTTGEKEKFLRINGAAILYPYVRAYISTITSFDEVGGPLIVPTINFQKLYKELTEKNNKIQEQNK